MAGISAALRGEVVEPAVRRRALRRLALMRSLELVNAVLLPAVVVTILVDSGRRPGVPTAVGALLCAALLLVGSAYWWVKRRQLRAGAVRPPLPGWQAFAAVRRWAPVALAAGLLTWLVPLLDGRGDPVEPLAGAVLWGMATLEYVNYFGWQLMHDTAADWRRLAATRRLRRSFLAQDLASSAATKAGTRQ